MKKKLTAVMALTAISLTALLVTACGEEKKETEGATDATMAENLSGVIVEDGEDPFASYVPDRDSIKIEPMASEIDINDLENAVYLETAGTFKASDVKKNGDGYELTMTLYDYDRYDSTDFDDVGVGDTVVINGEDVLVTDCVYGDRYIFINGGTDAGGYNFYTEDFASWYIQLKDEKKPYYEVGTVTLPLGELFSFIRDYEGPEGEELEPLDAEGFAEFMHTAGDAEYSVDTTTLYIDAGELTGVIVEESV